MITCAYLKVTSIALDGGRLSRRRILACSSSYPYSCRSNSLSGIINDTDDTEQYLGRNDYKTREDIGNIEMKKDYKRYNNIATIEAFVLTLTTVARSGASVPSAPRRPLTNGLLRWWCDLGRSRTRWKIYADDVVVIVTNADSSTESRGWIRTRASTCFHREATRLRTR